MPLLALRRREKAETKEIMTGCRGRALLILPRALSVRPSVSLPAPAVPSGRSAMAVARSESLLFRAEDSGLAATSSAAEHQQRPTSTIRQHYYPEGGWGWVVVVCAVLVQVLAHGMHGAAGVWLQETLGRFPAAAGLPSAGTSGGRLELGICECRSLPDERKGRRSGGSGRRSTTDCAVPSLSLQFACVCNISR